MKNNNIIWLALLGVGGFLLYLILGKKQAAPPVASTTGSATAIQPIFTGFKSVVPQFVKSDNTAALIQASGSAAASLGSAISSIAGLFKTSSLPAPTPATSTSSARNWAVPSYTAPSDPAIEYTWDDPSTWGEFTD